MRHRHEGILRPTVVQWDEVSEGGVLIWHLLRHIVRRDKLSLIGWLKHVTAVELSLDSLALIKLSLLHVILSIGALVLVRLVSHEWLLYLCPPSGDGLKFLDLQNSATIGWLNVLAVTFTVLFEFFVDIK